MTKHEKLWRAARAEWVRNHPPNHEGYYVCWMCHRWVPASEMELDHVIARSRRPDLRYVQSNLAPSCHRCNTEKGSREFTDNRGTFQDIDNVW